MKTEQLFLIVALIGALAVAGCSSPVEPRFPEEPDPEEPPPDDRDPTTSYLSAPEAPPIPVYFA